MQTQAAFDTLPPHLQSKAAIIPNPCVLPAGVVRSEGDGSRIVAVGRLDRQKGFDLLLEAFARMAADAPHATLTIFGEGPERPALQERIDTLGLESKVRMPGISELPGAWLAAGDVFVLSSRYEGFPNVLVEALAGGLACVAFDCPWGPSSVLTHERDGILIRAEDVEGLAAALLRMTTDHQLRLRLTDAAVRTSRRFGLPSILSQWNATLARATGTKASGIAVPVENS
jgi:glycosyltransferase involved in cell wall biosynthesis